MTASEFIVEMYPDAIVLKDFNEAIIGVERSAGRAVYSVEKIVKKLMERDGMSEQAAEEFFEYNIENAYLGELGPIFVDTYL